jgi:hypothetical protein
VGLDAYTIRARVLPAVISFFPLILLGSLTWFEPLVGLIPAIGGIALAYWASEFVRQRGLHHEIRLKTKWGGMPTTMLLRFGAHGASRELTARRRAIEQVTGRKLPSAVEEDADPTATEATIERIVRLGIAQVRKSTVEAALLQQENTGYGFRRNLRALKPFGLTAVVASIVLALAFAYDPAVPQLQMVIVIVNVVCGLAWLLMVRDAWVHEQAKKYAERFFVAIESIAINEPAAKE